MLRQLFIGLGVLVATAGICRGEDYPSRPITFIVPWGAGGGADQTGRVAARLMERELNVALPVVNIPGATGQTGLTKLLTAPADGYTVEIMTADTFALQVGGKSNFSIGDLKLLAIMIQQKSGMFVSSNSPIKSWVEVQQISKERPLKIAITGFGSPDDLTIGLLRKQGMKLVGVPYPEPGLRYSALIGGQVDLLYTRPGDMRGLVDGDQVRPLLFFSDAPVPEFPGVPTSAELKLGTALTQFRVLALRSGTPTERVETISRALSKVVDEPEYRDQLQRQIAQSDGYVAGDKVDAFVQDWLSKAKDLAASASRNEK